MRLKSPEVTVSEAPPIYICTMDGDDIKGNGTADKPYKSISVVMDHSKGTPTRKILVRDDSKSEFQPITKTSLKKATKRWTMLNRAKDKKQSSLADSEDSNTIDVLSLDNADGVQKSIDMLNEMFLDLSLPTPIETPIGEAYTLVGKRITVKGWVNRLRSHANLVFIIIRNGGSYIQCIVSGENVNTKEISLLSLETSIQAYGTVKKVPEGKNAPNSIELAVDYLKIIGNAPLGSGSFSNKLNTEAGPEVLYDLRHLVIRGDNASSVLRFRSRFLKYLRQFFEEENLVEITPPTLVKSQTEGGSTLFSLNYYGDNVYLTQSSQFYLEVALPAVGDCYCITSSYRAETSHTRRHLSEYSHLEVELGFIEFNNLMNFIEQLVVYVSRKLTEDETASKILKEKNPDFRIPDLPFLRMNYADAIVWLNKNKVMKKVVSGDGSEMEEDYVFGDDIPEAAERKLVDTMARPIFIYGFPKEIKAFYMQKVQSDKRVTESCDLLMPNVGEIVGGSMRITDYDELIDAYKSVNIDPTDYYWYTEQRVFGTVPHGGFGLGVERLLAWILNLYTVREACLFPRYVGRCVP